MTDDRSEMQANRGALMEQAVGGQVWENMSEAARSWSSERPLTHLIDSTDRQAPMNVTCSVDGCERPLFRNEICSGHYDRLRRTGELGGPDFRPQLQGTGTCKAEGCDRPIKGSGKRGWCGTHHQRWRVTGDPGTEPIKLQGTSDISYGRAHGRVKEHRGTADQHPCAHCEKRAAHWAYDHEDPNEKRSSEGLAYSTDEAHYMPLCVSCHARFDWQWKNFLGGGGK